MSQHPYDPYDDDEDEHTYDLSAPRAPGTPRRKLVGVPSFGPTQPNPFFFDDFDRKMFNRSLITGKQMTVWVAPALPQHTSASGRASAPVKASKRSKGRPKDSREFDPTEVIDTLTLLVTRWFQTNSPRPKLDEDILQPQLWGDNERTPSKTTAERCIREYGKTLGQPNMGWKAFVQHVRRKTPKNH